MAINNKNIVNREGNFVVWSLFYHFLCLMLNFSRYKDAAKEHLRAHHPRIMILSKYPLLFTQITP